MKFGSLFLAFLAVSLAASTERELIRKRIHDFYATPTPDQMNIIPEKFDAKTGEPATIKSPLATKVKVGMHPLEKAAQLKSTDEFLDHQCKTFLDKKFPQLKCSSPGGRATAEPNDQVEDLTETWLERPTHDLNEIPVEGKTALPIWSDDYWRVQWGITSYRYAEGAQFSNYTDAVEAYKQPAEWTALVNEFDPNRITKAIRDWSPAEKYDLTVGDNAFGLTNEQKQEGRSHMGTNGNVEGWMGICHGWAAAAIVVPKADRPVRAKGLTGIEVQWYPSDIRAMASLAWANGSSGSNFIGGRCNAKRPQTDNETGRILQQECFDNNPATFHLSLGNMVGLAKASFVMDKTFDYEVWNQPIQSYEFEYFNVLDNDQYSTDWKKVAVDYEKFKKKDRFKGHRGATDKIVGVIASVVYLAEVFPAAGERPAENHLLRVSYTYDLELKKEGNQYRAIGGEWHTNAHPDFLWVPRRGRSASLPFDRVPANFSLTSEPEQRLTEAARAGSERGYPLCKVVRALISESSQDDSYKCRE